LNKCQRQSFKGQIKTDDYTADILDIVTVDFRTGSFYTLNTQSPFGGSCYGWLQNTQYDRLRYRRKGAPI
jgi:hypothetical protein